MRYAILITLLLAPATVAAQHAPDTEIFVLGALHDREEHISFEPGSCGA